MTGSLLSIVPLVVAFLLLQRYWQSGLATGSVKQWQYGGWLSFDDVFAR